MKGIYTIAFLLITIVNVNAALYRWLFDRMLGWGKQLSYPKDSGIKLRQTNSLFSLILSKSLNFSL